MIGEPKLLGAALRQPPLYCLTLLNSPETGLYGRDSNHPGLSRSIPPLLYISSAPIFFGPGPARTKKGRPECGAASVQQGGVEVEWMMLILIHASDPIREAVKLALMAAIAL